MKGAKKKEEGQVYITPGEKEACDNHNSRPCGRGKRRKERGGNGQGTRPKKGKVMEEILAEKGLSIEGEKIRGGGV